MIKVKKMLKMKSKCCTSILHNKVIAQRYAERKEYRLAKNAMDVVTVRDNTRIDLNEMIKREVIGHVASQLHVRIIH